MIFHLIFLCFSVLFNPLFLSHSSELPNKQLWYIFWRHFWPTRAPSHGFGLRTSDLGRHKLPHTAFFLVNFTYLSEPISLLTCIQVSTKFLVNRCKHFMHPKYISIQQYLICNNIYYEEYIIPYTCMGQINMTKIAVSIYPKYHATGLLNKIV